MKIVVSGKSMETRGAGNIVCAVYSEPQVSRNFDLFSVGTGVFLIFSFLFSGIIHSMIGKGIAVIVIVILANLLIVSKNRFLLGRARRIVANDAYAYTDLLVAEPWLVGAQGADTSTVAMWADARGEIHSGIMSCRQDIFGCDVYRLTNASNARIDNMRVEDMESPWFDIDHSMTPGQYWMS